MKVDAYTSTAKRGLADTILNSFCQGVKNSGDEVIFTKAVGLSNNKFAAMFGFGRSAERGPKQTLRYNIVTTQTKNGNYTICLDGGLFQSFGATPNYVRVGVNSPMRNGIFLNKNSPADRWNLIKNDLNITVKDWTITGDYIVICLQPIGNWSMNGLDSVKLCVDWIEEIRTNSNRYIKIRPHPKHKEGELQNLASNLKKRNIDKFEITETGRNSFIDSLENAWAMVTFNSTASVDSVVSGIHTFTLSPLSMAWDVSGHDLTKIDTPTPYNRNQWLYNLGYTTWRIDELEEGTPWRRFRDNIS